MVRLNNPKNWTHGLLVLFVSLVVLIGTTSCGGGDTGVNAVRDVPPPPSSGTSTLRWSEEFASPTLSAKTWNYDLGYGENGWGNDESQLYTSSASNVGIVSTVEGDSGSGYLYITARCPSGACGKRNGSITSARITTKDKLEFQYGIAQARIKISNGRSVWAAFWMLGASFPETPWPRAGEIDIMETFWTQGSDDRIAHFAMHWEDPINTLTRVSSTGQKRLDSSQKSLSEDFHIYELDWNSERIIGKVDGVTYFTQLINPTTMSEFLNPFFFILNVAIDGTLGGAPEAIMDTPQTMLVDWVRIYESDSPEVVDYLYSPSNALTFLADTAGALGFRYDPLGSNSKLEGNYKGDADFNPVWQVADGDGYATLLGFNAFTAGFAQNYENLVFKIKGLPTGSVWVLFNDGVDDNDPSGVPETQIEFPLATYATDIDGTTGWKQVKIPLSKFPNLSAYTLFAISAGLGNGGSFLMTDIGFLAGSTRITTGSGPSSGSGTPVTPMATMPATAAPTPPVREAAAVISIFSNAYTGISSVNLNPDWGQSGFLTTGTESIAGNTVYRMSNFNYQGIDFSANAQNVSPTFDMLHLDYYTVDANLFNVFLISLSPTMEVSYAVATTLGSWQSLDIPLSHFASGVDLTKIQQMKFDGGDKTNTIYLDNIYFYKKGGTTQTPTPTTTTRVVFDDSLNPEWDAGISAFDQAINFSSCENDKGAGCPSINWDFVQSPGRGTVIMVTYAGTQFAGMVIGRNDSGIDLSAFTDGTLVFDVNITANPNSVKLTVKADCLPTDDCKTDTGQREQRNLGSAGPGWQEIRVPVVDMINANGGPTGPGQGLRIAQVTTGLVVFAPFNMTTGVAFQLDNIRWISAGAAAPVAPVAASGNLATNGDFETGDLTGWELFPGDGAITADNSQANGGTYSGKLVATGSVGGAQDVLFKQANLAVGTVKAGDMVKISFDLYGSLAGVGGVVFAEFFSELSGGGTSKNEILGGGSLTPSTTWTNYSYTTTAGSNVSGGITLQLKAGCGAVNGCQVNAYFDNVSITINQ